MHLIHRSPVEIQRNSKAYQPKKGAIFLSKKGKINLSFVLINNLLANGPVYSTKNGICILPNMDQSHNFCE